MSGIDLRAAQLEAARWYILLALDAGRPMSVAEDVILWTVADTRHPMTVTELRRELDYLKRRGLVELEGEKTEHWAATLTQLGVDVVNYTVEVKPGIARPPKRV